MKETKISVFTLEIIAIVLAVALLLPTGIHALFGFSIESQTRMYEVVTRQHAMLMPYAFFGFGGGSHTLNNFSGHFNLTTRQISSHGNPNSPTLPYQRVNLRFRHGRAFLYERYDTLAINTRAHYTQDIFWNAPRTTYWDNIMDENHYIAWLGFENPIGRTQLLDMFPTIFVGSVYCCNRGECTEATDFLQDFGIAWFAFKTSYDPSDILLGTPGNITRSNVNPHVIDHGRLVEFENCFLSSLQFLYQQQRTSDLIISSGIWGDIEIDFQERFYVGWSRQYLGFVAHIRGYDLRNLYDTGVNLVRLIEDN